MEYPLFPFRTGFQCVLESREQLPQPKRLFGLLHREGFYGAELNLPDLDLTKPEELKSLLNEYQMEMDMLVTGVYMKTHGLSFSSGIPEERMRAVNDCKRNIDYTVSMGRGIITGFLKGGPGSDREVSEWLLLEPMLELKPYIEEKKAQVLTGATSHKEASITRTLKGGAHMINFLDCPFIQLLADIYHMNAEEPSLVDSLSEYINYYSHLYIPDDNRAYSGLDSLDFTAIYRKLMERGYKGTVTAEGNIQHGLLEDTQICAVYLHKMCNSLHTPPRVSSYAVQ